MKNLNDLQARFDVLCTEFNEYRLSEFMTGLLSQDAFMQKHASLVAELGALQAIINRLESEYTASSCGTLFTSLTYTHFVGGHFSFEGVIVAVTTNLREAIIRMRHISINKHLVLRACNG